MKRTHLIRLVYIDTTGKRATEDEIVLVDAESLEAAAAMAMTQNTIAAAGRLVEKYDEDGQPIYSK